MSKIKVYVRVRPPLPKEFDEPGCFNCLDMEDVSGNWIQVKKDGEPRRYFARCWGPQSSQEECFRTVGVNTVNDVFEGYYGCIFVYGQTGTGKTFTLGCQVPGLEGIQPRCLKMAFEKINKEAHKYDVVAKFQYVQLYRDSVQDLLNIAKDDLVVRVDEQTGATIEDVTTRECRTYEESLELIREGDSNRAVANTKMNSGSSRSHACLIMEVFRTNKETGEKTFGRLYLIDLAGSERVSKSGVTGDQYKEAVAINKSLTTLGNCISGLVNGEKIIAFRESKLTRLLQHSLSGHGRTSIVVTLRPDSPNMQETLCTLKFGERAQKVEAQMTPAGFRDQMLEARDKALETERAIADNHNIAAANKRWAADLMEVVRRRGEEIRALEASSEAEVQQHRRAAEEEKKRIRDALEAEKAALTEKHNAETKALREANASVLAEVDRKIAEAVRKAEERGAASMRPLEDSRDRARRECEKAKESSQGISVSATDVAAKVAVELARVTKEKEVLQRKIRGCRQSRFAMLSTVPEIEAKRDATEKLRRVLERKRAWLAEQMEEWDEDIGKKAFKKEKKTVDDIRSYALLEAGWSTPQPESDAESSAPPSSEPPPTDSDMTDSDSTSDSDSDSSSGSGSSSSGSGSSNSDSGSDVGSDDDAERTDKVTMDWGASGARRKDTFIKIVPPRKHLDNAMKRDKQLAELVEQIAEYLEFGSTCYIVNTKSPPASIHRRHLFLDKARKTLCAAEYKAPKEGGGPNVPDKESAREIMPLSEVGAIVLGQFSEGMLRALEGAPIVPHGTQMPETSAKITLSALPVFFYRSLTICTREKPIVDIVLDTDTDFEAWIVTLQRLTRKEPRWGGALELTLMKDVAKLSEDEKKLCQDCHIVPTVLLNAKDEILNRQQKVFYTLFDVRTVSGLDLLHAQWVFDFFMRQEYFERVQLNHVRYLEMQAELTAENAAREATRQLRVRIVNMHRHWVNAKASEGELHNLLRSSANKEQAVLDELLQKYGREPTPQEIEALEHGGAVARPAVLQVQSADTMPEVPASPLGIHSSSGAAAKHADPTAAPPAKARSSSSDGDVPPAAGDSDSDAPPPADD